MKNIYIYLWTKYLHVVSLVYTLTCFDLSKIF
jgi:hypothetical protein